MSVKKVALRLCYIWTLLTEDNQKFILVHKFQHSAIVTCPREKCLQFCFVVYQTHMEQLQPCKESMQKPMMKYHYSLIKSYFLKKRSQKHRRRWEMHLWHLVYSILLYFTVLLLISFFEYLSPTIYGFCLTECTFSLFRIRSTINKLLQFLSS